MWGDDDERQYITRTHTTQLKLLLQQVEQQLERKQREMMEWKVRGVGFQLKGLLDWSPSVALERSMSINSSAHPSIHLQ